MSVVQAPSVPTHTLGGTTFTSLATPSRGSTTDNSLWRVQLAPGTTPTPHSLTREEIFLVLRIVNGRPADPTKFIETTFGRKGLKTTTRFFGTTGKILAAARKG